MEAYTHKPTAREWLQERLAGKERLIASLKDDIERIRRRIEEAEAESYSLARELADISKPEAA